MSPVIDERTDDACGGGRIGPSAAVTLAMTVLAIGSVHAAFRATWSLGLGAAATFVVCGRISFSAARDTGTLLVTTALIGTAAAVCTFARPLWRVTRRQVSRAEACAVGVGGVVGAGPLAALAFVYAGAFTPRVECEPGWVAAGPLIAYALFAPAGIAAAELCGLALMLAPRRPAFCDEKRT
jgi:hypothetical protein